MRLDDKISTNVKENNCSEFDFTSVCANSEKYTGTLKKELFGHRDQTFSIIQKKSHLSQTFLHTYRCKFSL